jgi:uncharacterized protein
VNRTLLDVRVSPGASRDQVEGLMADGRIKIRLRAKAVEDAANEALVKFVADCLRIGPRSVWIVTGLRARMKTLEISGLAEADVRARLLEKH